jgi:Predicted HD-superfamily hydrolase
LNKDTKEIIKERLLSTNKIGIKELVKYLEEKTDYFTAPASTKFHSNFEGGLAEHSHNVVELFKEKNERFSLGLSDETIYIVGYLHDLCKCNLYNKSMKLKKDEMTGKWIGYDTYEIIDKTPLGHGEKSVILIQQFLTLTLEECLIIRWHMGAYVPKEDLNNFRKATELYKSVSAFHHADDEASIFLERIEPEKVHTVEEYNEFMRKKAKGEV